MATRGGTVSGIGTSWTDVFVADAIGGGDGDRCRGVILKVTASAQCRVYTKEGAPAIHRRNTSDHYPLAANENTEFTGIQKIFGVSLSAIERVQVKADSGTVDCDFSVNFG